MEVLYPRCAGLDVHAKSVTACVRIAADATITYDHYTAATTTRGLLALDAWLTDHGCTHVAMEATGVYWKPVWHVLEDHFTLVLANAMHIRNVPGRKSDTNDARWIADLLAHGLIRSSFIPPAPIQALRDLTRTRRQLGREVARHIQRVQKTLEDTNIKLTRVLTDIMGMSGRAILAAIIAGETDPDRLAALTRGRLKASRADLREALHGRVTEHHRFVIQLHLTQIDGLEGAIAAIDVPDWGRAGPRARRGQAAGDHAGSERDDRTIAGRGDRDRHVAVSVARASRVLGRAVPAAGSECRHHSLDTDAAERPMAQADASHRRMVGDAQEGQLSARAIPPAEESARSEEGHSRRRQLDAHRRVCHAPRWRRVSRPRSAPL